MGPAPPKAFNVRKPTGAAPIAPATAILPSRAFARISPSCFEAYAIVSPFFTSPWIFERTSISSTIGKSRFESSCGARNRASRHRPAAAANVTERRGPARSRIGTINGPARASGSTVRPRNNATRRRDSATGTWKKIESASEIASNASPATLVRWLRP